VTEHRSRAGRGAFGSPKVQKLHCDCDRDGSFEHVCQANQQPGHRTNLAEHVGGTGIAGSSPPDISDAVKTGDQHCVWNGAGQVTEGESAEQRNKIRGQRCASSQG
jgi:hypothetical protein